MLTSIQNDRLIILFKTLHSHCWIWYHIHVKLNTFLLYYILNGCSILYKPIFRKLFNRHLQISINKSSKLFNCAVIAWIIMQSLPSQLLNFIFIIFCSSSVSISTYNKLQLAGHWYRHHLLPLFQSRFRWYWAQCKYYSIHWL